MDERLKKGFFGVNCGCGMVSYSHFEQGTGKNADLPGYSAKKTFQ